MEDASNILTIKEVVLARPEVLVGMSNNHWATGTQPAMAGALVLALEPPVLGTFPAGGERLKAA